MLMDVSDADEATASFDAAVGLTNLPTDLVAHTLQLLLADVHATDAVARRLHERRNAAHAQLPLERMNHALSRRLVAVVVVGCWRQPPAAG